MGGEGTSAPAVLLEGLEEKKLSLSYAVALFNRKKDTFMRILTNSQESTAAVYGKCCNILGRIFGSEGTASVMLLTGGKYIKSVEIVSVMASADGAAIALLKNAVVGILIGSRLVGEEEEEAEEEEEKEEPKSPYKIDMFLFLEEWAASQINISPIDVAVPKEEERKLSEAVLRNYFHSLEEGAASKVTIRCVSPDHEDKNPSMVLFLKKRGRNWKVRGYCRSCGYTRFLTCGEVEFGYVA